MKIPQLCPVYFPVISGVEERVRNVSERLAREHDFTLFATDPSDKLTKEESINGILIVEASPLEMLITCP